jgi:putative hydrolase of the HAD superfamily
MQKKLPISTLFLDIGGVLLTNGWDRQARKKAVSTFSLNAAETEERHHLTFDTYEVGKISLAEYLDRVVFYEKRSFTRAQFRRFMYERSQPFPEMISLVQSLKKKYQLKIAVVSNEGRELTEYRINRFKLNQFVDFFISSCYVHFRKPDADIFRVALDTAQAPSERVLYIEDRMMFVQVAEKQGIQGIHHEGVNSTREKLKKWKLIL